MSSPETPTPTWERQFANQLPALMGAIDQLEAWLHMHHASPQATYLARLAAEEMGSNIVKYGYDDTDPHEITLRASALGETFRLELIDDGHPFDPTAHPDPPSDAGLEEREPGGWGISLIRRMAAGVTYERQEPFNQLTILIRRSPESG